MQRKDHVTLMKLAQATEDAILLAARLGLPKTQTLANKLWNNVQAEIAREDESAGAAQPQKDGSARGAERAS